MRLLLPLLCLLACSTASVSKLAAAGGNDPQAGSPPGAPERELARTAHAEIERDDPEAGPPAVAELAKRNGGWVASSAERSVTIAVPADRLEPVLADLAKLGKVTGRHLAARDVTAPHRDLRIREGSLRRERDRYLVLLERAVTVADAAAVEREVERLTTQLELIEAQLQAMNTRVEDAEVRVDFSRELKPGPIGYLFYGVYSGIKWLFVRD